MVQIIRDLILILPVSFKAADSSNINHLIHLIYHCITQFEK
jgi:hypothetical protein